MEAKFPSFNSLLSSSRTESPPFPTLSTKNHEIFVSEIQIFKHYLTAHHNPSHSTRANKYSYIHHITTSTMKFSLFSKTSTDEAETKAAGGKKNSMSLNLSSSKKESSNEDEEQDNRNDDKALDERSLLNSFVNDINTVLDLKDDEQIEKEEELAKQQKKKSLFRKKKQQQPGLGENLSIMVTGLAMKTIMVTGSVIETVNGTVHPAERMESAAAYTSTKWSEVCEGVNRMMAGDREEKDQTTSEESAKDGSKGFEMVLEKAETSEEQRDAASI